MNITDIFLTFGILLIFALVIYSKIKKQPVTESINDIKEKINVGEEVKNG